MEKLIRFSDFIRIFQVDDKHHFFLRGFQARNNGIWLESSSESYYLSSLGLGGFNLNIEDNIEISVQTFPCTLQQLLDFFSYYKVSDIEERFDLSEFKTSAQSQFPQIKTMETHFAKTIAFYADGFLPDTKLIHESRNEQWQQTKAEWAINNGAIRATYLVCLLASDKSYIPALSNYWIKFQMNIAGDYCPDPSTFESRVNIWTALFQRWTHGDVLGITQSNLPEHYDNLEPIQPLEFSTTEYTTIDGKNASYPIIDMNNFLNFLSKWEIPLPSIFTPDGTINDFETDLSPQRLPKGCNERDKTSNKTKDELILEFGEAAERFYQCMAKQLCAENKTLTHAKKDDLKTAAHKVFNANPKAFYPLTKEYIEGDGLYTHNEKQKRFTVGMVLKNVFLHDATIESDYQKLYKRYYILKKSHSQQKKSQISP